MIVRGQKDEKCAIDTLQSLVKDLKSGKIRLREFTLDTPVQEVTQTIMAIREYQHTGEVYLSMYFTKVT